MTAKTPATPLRRRVVDAAHRAGNLDDRRTIHELWTQRAKLVEALQDSIRDLQLAERHYPQSAKTVLERRRALLRSLGEDA